MDLAIILYTISDDELREKFANALELQGFENHPDQSTYTFPQNKVGEMFMIDKFSAWLKKWSNSKAWADGDFVSVYYLTKISDASNFMTIKNKYFTLK